MKKTVENIVFKSQNLCFMDKILERSFAKKLLRVNTAICPRSGNKVKSLDLSTLKFRKLGSEQRFFLCSEYVYLSMIRMKIICSQQKLIKEYSVQTK